MKAVRLWAGSELTPSILQRWSAQLGLPLHRVTAACAVVVACAWHLARVEGLLLVWSSGPWDMMNWQASLTPSRHAYLRVWLSVTPSQYRLTCHTPTSRRTWESEQPDEIMRRLMIEAYREIHRWERAD